MRIHLVAISPKPHVLGYVQTGNGPDGSISNWKLDDAPRDRDQGIDGCVQRSYLHEDDLCVAGEHADHTMIGPDVDVQSGALGCEALGQPHALIEVMRLDSSERGRIIQTGETIRKVEGFGARQS